MSASNAFVLLCAEEDDLALVEWVHAARQRGLAPEVVVGVEHDDAPLLDALADEEAGLFVVLRSDNLGPSRMRQIKTAFARHRRPTQRLFALRIDCGATMAIARIANELTSSRPRSDLSMIISMEDMFDPAPDADRPLVEVPSVDAALRLADRAEQAEVTAQFQLGDETIPMATAALIEPAPTPAPKRRGSIAAWIAGVGLAAAASTAAVFVDIDIDVDGSKADAAPRIERGATVEPAGEPAGVQARAAAPVDGGDASATDEVLADEVVVIDADGSTSPGKRGAPHRRKHPRAQPAPTATPATEGAAPESPPEPALGPQGVPLEPAPLDPPVAPAVTPAAAATPAAAVTPAVPAADG